MTKIAYINKAFQPATLEMIHVVNSIIGEYARQGFSLTLRQLYYQIVARGLFPDSRRWAWDAGKKKWYPHPNGTKNADPNYKWLGGLVSDGRKAGLISWTAIEDRTRNLRKNTHWRSPQQIMQAAIDSYYIDMWADQEYRLEVWIEKDALIGVVADICEELDVPYFSCRGYTSDSEMWTAGHGRMKKIIHEGFQPIILHLGDHDPSGLDMSRDIVDRLALYSTWDVEVQRIALNMEQIETMNIPSDPAKMTDSRAIKYVQLYGDDSWELDAMEPQVMVDLIRETVLQYRDEELWEGKVQEAEDGRSWLRNRLKGD